MKITYDPQANALYVLFHDADVADTVEIEDSVIVDMDKDGHVVGIEMLDASKRMTPEELTSISYQNLLLAAEEVPP